MFRTDPATAPAPTLASAALPRRVARALESVQGLVASDLGAALERMLGEFEQQLFVLADHARNPALQSGYMDTLATVRINRARVAPAFLREVEAGLAGIRAHAQALDAEGKPRALPFRQLSLVDDQELDEDTLLRDMVQRQEARASLPLQLLGQRFGVLAGSPAHDAERLPVGPAALARAMREAARTLQVGGEARMLLFKTFDRVVLSNFEAVAKLLDARLVREGILPSLSFVPLRVRAPAQRPQEPDGPSQDAPPMLGWLPTASAAGRDGSDDVSLLMMLRELLAQRRLASHDMEVPVARAPREEDPPAGRAPSEPAAPVSARVAACADPRDAADIVDLVYRQVARYLRPGAPASSLLEQLREPIARLAANDPAILLQSRHPARQLLDAVAESGARWIAEADTDPQLPEQLREAVEVVASAEPGDPGVFDVANRKLQQHLQQLARRAEVAERRQVEAARGREKLELAKRCAANVIAEEVRHQPLSRFVQTLLDQAWADVLTLTLLRHGEGSPEWQQRLDVTREVVGIATGLRPGTFNPALTSSVRDALLQVGYHADDAQAIARRLTSGVADDEDDPASRTELAMRLKSRTRLGDAATPGRGGSVAYSPEEEAALAHLRTLPLGTWFEFRLPDGTVRRRLSWFSAVTNCALFVNQRGQRADERSLQEVAGLLARGDIRPIQPGQGALVDQAWRDAIATLRGDPGEAAP